MTGSEKATHTDRQRKIWAELADLTPEQYTPTGLAQDYLGFEWPTLPAIAYFDDGELADCEVYLNHDDADAAYRAFWCKLGLRTEDEVERYRMDGGKRIAVYLSAGLIGPLEHAGSDLLVLPDDLYWNLLGSGIAVVMSESGLKAFAERLNVSHDEAYRLAQKAAADYDFGGEADREIDFVDSTDHLFFRRVQEIAS